METLGKNFFPFELGDDPNLEESKGPHPGNNLKLSMNNFKVSSL